MNKLDERRRAFVFAQSKKALDGRGWEAPKFSKNFEKNWQRYFIDFQEASSYAHDSPMKSLSWASLLLHGPYFHHSCAFCAQCKILMFHIHTTRLTLANLAPHLFLLSTANKTKQTKIKQNKPNKQTKQTNETKPNQTNQTKPNQTKPNSTNQPTNPPTNQPTNQPNKQTNKQSNV